MITTIRARDLENLPIAIPIAPELGGFEALLEFVAESFRISNIEKVRIPPWEATLL
jgi:hypothetical protein